MTKLQNLDEEYKTQTAELSSTIESKRAEVSNLDAMIQEAARAAAKNINIIPKNAKIFPLIIFFIIHLYPISIAFSFYFLQLFCLSFPYMYYIVYFFNEYSCDSKNHKFRNLEIRVLTPEIAFLCLITVSFLWEYFSRSCHIYSE